MGCVGRREKGIPISGSGRPRPLSVGDSYEQTRRISVDELLAGTHFMGDAKDGANHGRREPDAPR
jgi:hypothetical protein